MPVTRDPRPVYIVPAPAPASRHWFGILVIAALVILVGGAALNQRQQSSSSAPPRAPGLFVPDVTAAPTPDLEAVREAVADAVNRQAQRVNAKLAECNGVANDDVAYAKCDRGYQALDAQYTALDECTADVTSVAAVAACERKVGIH